MACKVLHYWHVRYWLAYTWCNLIYLMVYKVLHYWHVRYSHCQGWRLKHDSIIWFLYTILKINDNRWCHNCILLDIVIISACQRKHFMNTIYFCMKKYDSWYIYGWAAYYHVWLFQINHVYVLLFVSMNIISKWIISAINSVGKSNYDESTYNSTKLIVPCV